MSTTKALYVAGLENHMELLGDQQLLIKVGKVFGGDTSIQGNVAGNEDLKMVTQQLGSGLFSASKWIGGQSLTLFTKLLNEAGKGLIKTFADNDVLIRKIVQSLSSDSETEFKVTADKLNVITAEGNIDELNADLDTLINTLSQLTAHNKDILNHLDKQLLVARKLKTVTTSGQVFDIVGEFDALTYPEFKLRNHKGNTYTSDTLPGGKVWEFVLGESSKPTYLISGDKPAGAGTSITLSKSQVSNLLTKVGKVNSMHKDLKQFYDSYLGFIKSWSEMVKTVDGNLSKIKWLSKTATGEVEKILAGESNALAFYSGFTPRVVGYTDRYIHGVLGVFA